MFTFLGAHPQTFGFWSDLVVTLALFVSIIVMVLMAFQPAMDSVAMKLFVGTIPLSLVFGALLIGLSMQCCVYLKK